MATAYGRGIRTATNDDVQRVEDRLEQTNQDVAAKRTDIAVLPNHVTHIDRRVSAGAKQTGEVLERELGQDG